MRESALISLAQIVLSSEVLSSFDITKVESTDTEIYIHLDEKMYDTLRNDVHFESKGFIGSVVILGELSLVNSLHAYTFASLKRKKLISTTPLNDALNALILALNASAAAFVLLFTKKFKILS